MRDTARPAPARPSRGTFYLGGVHTDRLRPRKRSNVVVVVVIAAAAAFIVVVFRPTVNSTHEFFFSSLFFTRLHLCVDVTFLSSERERTRYSEDDDDDDDDNIMCVRNSCGVERRLFYPPVVDPSVFYYLNKLKKNYNTILSVRASSDVGKFIAFYFVFFFLLLLLLYYHLDYYGPNGRV